MLPGSVHASNDPCHAFAVQDQCSELLAELGLDGDDVDTAGGE